MKNIHANLLIIGNGVLYEKLNKLIEKLELKEKISIERSVPNDKIQDFYKSADIFALAYNPEVEGIPMPVMEAMATGLPVVIPPPKENFSEGLEGSVVFTKANPDSFAKSINELLNNKFKYKKVSDEAKKKATEFSAKNLEKREAQIYTELTKSKIK